jgi:hypothetical protein
MTSHTRRRAAHLGAVLLLGSLLTGCGDDPDPGTDPTAGASGSPGSSESGDPSESSGPTESASDPGVAPAGGETFEADQFAVSGPEGWRMKVISPRVVRYGSGEPRNNAQLTKRPHGLVFVDVSDVSGEPTLDELADESVRNDPRRPDTTIDGEPAYHRANRDQGFETQEEFGLWRDGQQIRVNFSLIGGTRMQRQALVKSVLASWQWT